MINREQLSLRPVNQFNLSLIQQSLIFKIYFTTPAANQTSYFQIFYSSSRLFYNQPLKSYRFYPHFSHISNLLSLPPPKGQLFTHPNTTANPLKQIPMSLNPSLHPSTNRINISESIQYQLTPTAKSTQYLQQSSSMLSLSNYLQQDQSSLYFKTNPKPTKNSIQPEKHKMFSEIQCAQKLFFKHLQTQFHDESVSQDSESMLLAYSSIKENKLSVFENSRYLNQEDKNTKFLENKQQINAEPQSFPSRINPKTDNRNKLICTDSIQLIQLLSIPKDTSFEKSKEITSKDHNAIDNDQMAKIQQIYQLINSNKNLFKKINFLPAQNDSNQPKCPNCINLNKKLQNLQNQLTQKQRQIKKYDSLIEKLNSNIFDLKIENKRLFFQNKQYSTQIEKLLEHKNQKPTIERVKTVNFDHLDNSLDNILKQSNGVSSSYTNLSRKTTKIFQNHNKNTESQNMEEIQHCYNLCDKKNYPQTPMPSYSQTKHKKVRRSSNHSDKKARISISQLRQPNIYQISQVKVQNSGGKLKENSHWPIHQLDEKSNCNHKSQKNIMRFSDLSKDINEHFKEQNIIEQSKRSSHQPLSQKSPIKAHGFLKLKSKKIDDNIESLKSHPLNKISQQDNNSQTSQTKTQKLYGLKKSSTTKQPIYEFTDYNMNINKSPTSQHKSLTRNGPQTTKIPETQSKNSIIYKSFKQIGNLYEAVCQKHESRVEKKVINAALTFGEYGSGFSERDQVNVYGTLRNRQKSQRNFYSPSPSSLASKRQNSNKIAETHSSYIKPQGLKAQMKSFLR